MSMLNVYRCLQIFFVLSHKFHMSGLSRRLSQRNLQRPSSQPSTPVRRAQGNSSAASSIASFQAHRFPLAPDSDDETDNSSVNILNATPSFLLGLREVVMKALLVDIERGGGLHVPRFSLKHLCNAKPDVYGNPGSELRRQVQNKVQKLRALDGPKYQQVLNYFGVESSALTRSFRPLDSTVAANLESPVRLPHRRAPSNDSPREIEDHVVVYDSPSRQRAVPPRPPSSVTRRIAMNQQRFFEEFDMDNVSKSTLHFVIAVDIVVLFTLLFLICLALADVIDVDLDRPENNREVVVLTVNDVIIDTNMYNCYDIALIVDMRDAAAASCTASLVSEHEVLISYPAIGYMLFRDSIQRNKRLIALRQHDQQVQLAQDVWINDVRRTPQRSIKQLLLRFPANVSLANVLNPFSYKIRPKVPIDYAPGDMFGHGHNIAIATAQMEFRVADALTHREAVIVADDAAPLDSMTDTFARMFHLGS